MNNILTLNTMLHKELASDSPNLERIKAIKANMYQIARSSQKSKRVYAGSTLNNVPLFVSVRKG